MKHRIIAVLMVGSLMLKAMRISFSVEVPYCWLCSVGTAGYPFPAWRVIHVFFKRVRVRVPSDQSHRPVAKMVDAEPNDSAAKMWVAVLNKAGA